MGKVIFKAINRIKEFNLFNRIYNLKYIKKQLLIKIYKEILDIIYPQEEKCIICNLDGIIGICERCKMKINKSKLEGDNLSYGFYGGVLKTLILKLKYESNYNVGYLLASFLLEIVQENKIYADVICYVPMSRKSEKKRGFNQCELIARELGLGMNIPVSNCIEKIKNTKEQKKLSREERVNNVVGAFKIKAIKDIKNKTILLIDDVMTTGATLNECKKILKNSGANKIIILTIAKSNI